MSFQQWMGKVNHELDSICGLVSDDLADINYRDLFDSGSSPHEAANECLEQNDFPGEFLN